MPYVCALFDPPVAESMVSTAGSIASGSSFEPKTEAFHVPLLGSLHLYSEETIAAAVKPMPTLHGRFGKWELHNGMLRATVEFEDTAALLSLHRALPRGRPWRSHYVVLGSIDLEATRQEEFLAAVAAAFPMSSDVTFTASRYEYHSIVPPAKAPGRKPSRPAHTKLSARSRKAPPSKSKLDPKAAPFEPGRSAAAKPGSTRGPIKKQPASRHLKWTKSSDAKARALTIDDLIKSSDRLRIQPQQ